MSGPLASKGEPLPATVVTGDASQSGGGPSALPERYRDLGRIARGAMGDVRRVHDALLDRRVAMKVLAWELVDSPGARKRFAAEACMTAGLQHPSIVAVHDRGELGDGRLWYTMPEVAGITFATAIAQLHEAVRDASWQIPSSGWSLPRLLESFRRVCDAVAFAHSRGVVHRDLKPANLMLGGFGEVVVMDWGLAKRLNDHDDTAGATEADDPFVREAAAGATLPGQVLGTPAFMPPEQARGEEVSFTADVYALGAVLHTILSGEPPFGGPSGVALAKLISGPPPSLRVERPGKPPLAEGLLAICERAMERDPARRYPDARALAADMAAWLDGSRRRREADAVIERAQAMVPRIERLRIAACNKRDEARGLLNRLSNVALAEEKYAAWQLQDEASEMEREISLLEVQWLQGLRAALNVDDAHPSAHALLAEHYCERLLEAERRRDAEEACRAEALLRIHDRGQHAAVLSNRGTLTLCSAPNGAEVIAQRYLPRHRRLVLGDEQPLGRTPLTDVPLECGSYLLTLRAPGRAITRYPLVIERGVHCVAVPPGGGAEPLPVTLRPSSELAPGDIHVPAGWAPLGGDPYANEGISAKRVWLDDFVIARDPVTNVEYMAFLNALLDEGREDEALALAPRGQLEGGGVTPRPVGIELGDDGRFRLGEYENVRWQGDWPLALVSWHAAMRYAEWRGLREGKPYRLLSELEWEKAARGVDRRICAWGDHIEQSWACLVGGSIEVPSRAPLDAHPIDESPYGVRATVGNVREWCLEVWELDGPAIEGDRLVVDAPAPDDVRARAIRGGSWFTSTDLARAAGRFASAPDRRFRTVGIRLGYSLVSAR